MRRFGCLFSAPVLQANASSTAFYDLAPSALACSTGAENNSACADPFRGIRSTSSIFARRPKRSPVSVLPRSSAFIRVFFPISWALIVSCRHDVRKQERLHPDESSTSESKIKRTADINTSITQGSYFLPVAVHKASYIWNGSIPISLLGWLIPIKCRSVAIAFPILGSAFKRDTLSLSGFFIGFIFAANA